MFQLCKKHDFNEAMVTDELRVISEWSESNGQDFTEDSKNEKNNQKSSTREYNFSQAD